jgi:hypothetical protein
MPDGTRKGLVREVLEASVGARSPTALVFDQRERSSGGYLTIPAWWRERWSLPSACRGPEDVGSTWWWFADCR